MADTIKTEYMGKANVGFSEYIVKKATDLDSIPAKPGDRAIIQEEGSIYICIEGGQWEKLNLPTGGGGSSITIDDEMSDSSANAVQNKVIKEYVDEADALAEKLANKVTVIDNTADNTKYPTALAVKNAIEAIPASSAIKTRVIIAPEDIEEFTASQGMGGIAEKPYYVEIEGKIPIGKIVDGAFVSTTNPAFLVKYEEENDWFVLDHDTVISNASFIATYQGMTISFSMDIIETFNDTLEIDNNIAKWHFETRLYTSTQAEAEQIFEIMQQLISTGDIQNMRFIYEIFVEKNLEFEE